MLPAHPLAGRALAARPIRSAKQPLQYQRIFEGSALPTGSGPGANRNHRAAALQRSISLPGWFAGVSRTHQFAAFPRAVRSFGTPGLAAVARPLADSHARTNRPSDLRSGQHGADGLWPSGTSRGGLQPQEAGAPLVPSAVVLRGEHAGLLGRHLPSGRHPRLDDHDPVVGAGLRQIARTDPRSESSCRWSVLRSRNRRIYRGKTRLLRDRGSAHPPAEESFGGNALRRISPGVWAAELRYCPQGEARPRRFVVIRRPVPEEPSAQLHLFQMGGYSYQLLVTNLALTPLHLWRFYNQRARAELIIRELKDAYALGKIPTKDFWANEAFFQIVLLAYNLLNWFKRLCVPVHLQGHAAAPPAAAALRARPIRAAWWSPNPAPRTELRFYRRFFGYSAAHPANTAPLPRHTAAGPENHTLTKSNVNTRQRPFFSRVEERRGY